MPPSCEALSPDSCVDDSSCAAAVDKALKEVVVKPLNVLGSN